MIPSFQTDGSGQTPQTLIRVYAVCNPSASCGVNFSNFSMIILIKSRCGQNTYIGYRIPFYGNSFLCKSLKKA